MQNSPILCYDCVYYHAVNARTCDAFPEKIPSEIWNGVFKHDKPYPGDHDIQFKPKFPKEFLSVNSVAKLFSLNPKTIYRALWDGRLPAYKIGKAWRIARKDLDRFKKK